MTKGNIETGEEEKGDVGVITIHFTHTPKIVQKKNTYTHTPIVSTPGAVI